MSKGWTIAIVVLATMVLIGVGAAAQSAESKERKERQSKEEWRNAHCGADETIERCHERIKSEKAQQDRAKYRACVEEHGKDVCDERWQAAKEKSSEKPERQKRDQRRSDAARPQ